MGLFSKFKKEKKPAATAGKGISAETAEQVVDLLSKMMELFRSEMAASEETEPEAEPESVPETKPMPAPKPAPKPKAESAPKSTAKSAPKEKPAEKPVTESEPKPEPKTLSGVSAKNGPGIAYYFYDVESESWVPCGDLLMASYYSPGGISGVEFVPVWYSKGVIDHIIEDPNEARKYFPQYFPKAR